MNKTILAIVAALSVVATVMYFNKESSMTSTVSAGCPIKDAWTLWKQTQGKSYGNNSEEEYRFGVFVGNFATINTHNASVQTSKMGLNAFADLTKAEFKAIYLGFAPKPLNSQAVTFSTANLKSSVNWVTAGAVGAVKDQGQCGSCWAFSAVSSTESANYIQKKMSSAPSYSEQQLVDCAGGSYGNQGCNGGLMDNAFDYIKDYPLETEADYGYTAQDGSCRYQSSKGVGTVSAHTDVRSGDADQLRAALNQQTVSVAIEADTSVFQFYTSGVITSSSCGQQLDHGVTAVGYGTEGGDDYFLVRNSWGASWGASGYVKIGASNDNICGILSQPSYPTA